MVRDERRQKRRIETDDYPDSRLGRQALPVMKVVLTRPWCTEVTCALIPVERYWHSIHHSFNTGSCPVVGDELKIGMRSADDGHFAILIVF